MRGERGSGPNPEMLAAVTYSKCVLEENIVLDCLGIVGIVGLCLVSLVSLALLVVVHSA